VTDCSCEGVRLGGDFVPARTIVWAAGVMASPAGRWLGAETDRVGRVKVRADLSVPGQPDVFVIGDTAAVAAPDGSMLRGVAPVAKQQGQYIARALVARSKGQTFGPFRYRDYGLLATIGRSRAVAQLGGLHISGFLAWVLWSVAHVYFLIGFRNRFSRRAELGMELHHVPARQSADHWTLRPSTGRYASGGAYRTAFEGKLSLPGGTPEWKCIRSGIFWPSPGR
jgi:NADH dehydrogenase